MRIFHTLLTVMLLGAAALISDAYAQSYPMSPVSSTKQTSANIVFIGDDIFTGAGILDPKDGFIQRFFKEASSDPYLPVRVIDATRNGDTADSVSMRMKEILALRPELAVLAIGFNDAMQKTDLDIFYNSMDSIMSDLYNAGVYVMVIGVSAPSATEDAYEAEFNRVFPKLAQRYGTYFLPSIMDGIYGNRNFTQIDRLHPNKEGVDKMMDRFLPIMRDMAKVYTDMAKHCSRNPTDPQCAVSLQYQQPASIAPANVGGAATVSPAAVNTTAPVAPAAVTTAPAAPEVPATTPAATPVPSVVNP